MTTAPFVTPCEGCSSRLTTPLRYSRPPQSFSSHPHFAVTACLVADVHMPTMTGIELYKHLVETGRPIPTILVTAYPDDSVQEGMLALGVECYLRKPLVEAVLIDCLRSAVARGDARPETQ
jgi:FixJ family two-component response regulator